MFYCNPRKKKRKSLINIDEMEQPIFRKLFEYLFTFFGLDFFHGFVTASEYDFVCSSHHLKTFASYVLSLFTE